MRGFTLLEMLVAMAVLVVLMSSIFAILQEISKAWQNSTGKIEGFRDARTAFEAMTRNISQATLNTYYDYVNGGSPPQFLTPGNAATFVPTTYGRRSDLHFISGTTTATYLSTVSQIPHPITHSIFFQAAAGDNSVSADQRLGDTLNACGFLVTYGTDPSVPAFITTAGISNNYRFRLLQFTEPAEYLSVYDPQTQGTAAPAYNQWFLGPLGVDLTPGTVNPTAVSQLAPNIVALVILPKLSSSDQSNAASLAPNYDYDSRNSGNSTTYNQLPPVVEVTMVAIDEPSALRLGNPATPPAFTQGLFANASQMEADLTTLENNLSAVTGNAAGNHTPLRFEVFQTEMAMQSAKWSK